MVALSYEPSVFDHLISEMDERPEQVGFMLARPTDTSDLFRVEGLRHVEGHRFSYRDETRADADDEIRAEMIKWAWDEGACLVEAHSHGRAFAPLRFSKFDFSQFEEWVPHVRWRLPERPYFALVSGGDQVDGLAWLSDRPVAIDAILIDGREAIATTGESYTYLMARHGR